MGGWLVGRSRAAATGYAIGLLAVVLVAAAALAQAEGLGAGQSSTFTVEFPRSLVTATPANGRVCSRADRSIGLEEAPDLTGIRGLIVEDDDDARALVAEERIDVLLSDIEMPRTEDRLRALRAGFQMHLPKLVQPAELITVVASLATRRD